MKTSFNQAQKTAIAVAALNRARKLGPELAAHDFTAEDPRIQEKGANCIVADESNSPGGKQATPPKVVACLYPPSLMLSDAEFAALQQRKRALGEYVMKAFAADKESSLD